MPKRGAFLAACLTVGFALTLLLVRVPAPDAPRSDQRDPLASLVAGEHLNPAPPGARLPKLASIPGGGIVLSWVQSEGQAHRLRFAEMREGRWVRSGEVAAGTRWFINWADFPSVVPVDESFWVAHWLVLTPGGKDYDYDIAVAVSRDAGRTWSKPSRPHRDAGLAEHGFLSIARVPDGAALVWLDGREAVSNPASAPHQHGSGRFMLRHAVIGRDGRIGPERVLDDNVCTCCNTSALAGPDGPLVAYRARRDGEIRDSYLLRASASGWHKPVALGGEGWHMPGCPVNGPTLAGADAQLVAAWFTAQGNRPRVRVAMSRDGGRRLAAPIDIDTDAPLGRVSAAWLGAEHAVVAWLGALDRNTGSSTVLLRAIRSDGALGATHRLAPAHPGRDSGMPQLAQDGQAIVVAWTDPGPGFGIRTWRLVPAAPNAAGVGGPTPP